MNDDTPTVPCTKKTHEYARHVRYWRDVQGLQVSLFSYLWCVSHVTRVCATLRERQVQSLLAHVKRVTLQVVTLVTSDVK
jgi:hypothetical protein